MGLLTTKSCCFCLSLRTGSLALGYLFIFHGIIAISDAIYRYIQPGYHAYYHYFVSKTTKFAVQIGMASQKSFLIKSVKFSADFVYRCSAFADHFGSIVHLAVWHL